MQKVLGREVGDASEIQRKADKNYGGKVMSHEQNID